MSSNEEMEGCGDVEMDLEQSIPTVAIPRIDVQATVTPTSEGEAAERTNVTPHPCPAHKTAKNHLKTIRQFGLQNFDDLPFSY